DPPRRREPGEQHRPEAAILREPRHLAEADRYSRVSHWPHPFASLAESLARQAERCVLSSILMLNQFGQMGGGERLLFDVATYLQPRWNISAMLPTGSFTDRLASAGVAVTPLAIPALQSGRKSLVDVLKFGL